MKEGRIDQHEGDEEADNPFDDRRVPNDGSSSLHGVGDSRAVVLSPERWTRLSPGVAWFFTLQRLEVQAQPSRL